MSEEVKRWGYHFQQLDCTATGDFVRFEDYQKLQAELAGYRKAMELSAGRSTELVDACKAINIEMTDCGRCMVIHEALAKNELGQTWRIRAKCDQITGARK